MCETLKSCVRGCAKVILVLINTVALVAGIALIVVGSLVETKGEEYFPDIGYVFNHSSGRGQRYFIHR